MKRKFTFLITAALMLLTMMATTGTMWGQTRATITDHMTAANLVATSSSYKDFSNVSLESDAVYAGNSAREYYNSQYNIQLRSNNSNSGIVTTTSGGNIASITITVSHGTNTVDIYGKNTAYSSASDLYNNNTQGTKIGSLSSTGTINVTDNYQYVGIRSKSGALYLSSIDFVWDDGSISNLQDSDLALTDAPVALNFDLYNNSSAQVINYTTSSTGAVTVSASDYVTTSVNETAKTITVTPTAVTPSPQTITVSQTADATYSAGSVTFTVTITNTPPAFTVTLGDDSSTLTEASSGAGVTLPTRSSLNGYDFAGWSETNVNPETTTAPTIIAAGEYHPTADITLYPVYSKTIGGGGSTNANASVTIANYASAHNWTNGVAYQPLVMDDYVSVGGTISGNNFKYYTSDNTWRFYTDGSFTISTSNNATLTSFTLTIPSGTLTYNDNTITSNTPVNVNGSTATINCTANAKITAIAVSYTIPGTGTTYYWSYPVAATVETPAIVIAENPFYFSTTATITCATEGAAIKYSFDGANWSSYSAALTITETTTIYAKAIKDEIESTTAYITATKNLAVPTVTIDATNITNTDVFTGTAAGSLSASITYNEVAIEGATVTWSGDADAVATIDASTGAVTLVAAGSVTFTATYAGNGDYSEKTATYQMTVTNTDPNIPGSQNNPYTVAQARAAIDAGTGVTEVYATGIVSEIVTEYSTQWSNITFDIVDESGDAVSLRAYRCGGDDAANVQVNDIAVIYGNLTQYGEIYEFASGCQLVSLEHPIVTEPTITVTPATVNVSAEGEEGTLTVTYDNINEVVAEVYFCDAQGGTATYDWITAEINSDKNVYYIIDANDGEARTAYLKVYALDDNAENVYSNLVNINQDEYVAPTYATLPFSFDGGIGNIANTDGLYQEGLGSDYSSSPKLKFDGTGDWLLLQFQERPGTLTFNIKNNSFSGGTFTVQTSEDGVTYTDLQAYTEITGTQNEEFTNLGENVRYIKWIYTEKSNGNVGLGNIALTKYAALAASITVDTDVVNATADETEGTLTVTYENIDFDIQPEVVWYESNGTTETTEPEWMSAEINNDNNVYYMISANAGEARTAYFKVYGLDSDANDVYSDLVTINQAAASQNYNLTVEPFENLGLITFVDDQMELEGDGNIQVTSGAQVMLSVVANEGYVIETLMVNGVDHAADIDANEHTYSFAMPGENVTISATAVEYIPPVGGNYVRINDISYLTDGAKVIIAARYDEDNTDGYYAMQNATTNKPTGVLFTSTTENSLEVLPSGITDEEDDYYWIVGVTENGYTFTNANGQLIGYNSGTNFATGGNNTEWNIEFGTSDASAMVANYEAFTITNHNNSGRGFALNSSHNFGPYATSNYNSSDYNFYLDFFVLGAEPVVTPSISLSSYEINAPASETIEILIITPANIENFDVDNLSADYCNADGSEIEGSKPDFVAFDFSENEGYKLTCTISDNDGDARTAYFKVIYELGENDYVYSNVVTVNQEAYVAPVATITVNPAEINIDANENIEELGVTVANISSIDLASFNIDYCNSDGSEIEGDKPDIIDDYEFTANTPEEGYTLTITFKANEGDARTAYFKVKYELGENDYVYSNVVAVNQESTEVVGVTYELVTSNNDIVSGAHYYIAGVNNLNAWFAMGQQKTNNRQAESVTVSNNSINQTDNVHEVVISSYNDGFYSIFDEDSNASSYGYLYAAGGTNNNYLKTYSIDDYDERGQWTISIDAETHVATITANITGRNIMRFNNGSSCFSCYASGQLDIFLFKKVDNTPSLSFNGSSANIGTYPTGAEIVWNNITVTQHNLTESISLSAKKGTVTPNSIDAGAEPTQVTWSYTPTAAGYTTDTITATSGTLQATLIIQFMAKTPHNIYTVVENGIIVVLDNKTTAIENENVDFTVTPDEGYELNEITVMAGETPVEYMIDETFYRFQMPDSDVTISATFNALPTYTIKFYVNGEQDEALTISDIVEGNSTALPTASTLTPAGFSIAGWAESGSTIAVADPYTPTDNVDLYALFQLDNAQTTSGNYVKVTEELTDWSGEYLIVYEDGNVAFNGNLETFDAVENTVNVEIASSTIIANDAMNNASFTIAPMTGGYSIQGTSGKYIGVGSYANGLTTNDDPVANAISIDESGNALITITFTGGDMTLKYNDAENQLRFRYYKSGQKDIQLYKKESTSFNTITILDNTIPEQTISDPIPNATCVVVPNNVTLTYTGPNPSTPEALVVQEGGQLIHTEDVEATIQKGVSGYTNKSGDGWYLISSPVDNLPTSSVATGTYDLFAYDEATAYWWVDHAIPGQPANHTFTTLSRGKGYLYANAADVNLNYAGTMKATDANFTVNLSYACDEYPDLKGFNLVGNPFTRNLTATDMVFGGTNVVSYYDFNADRTEFVTYQINERPIQPGQGFFIQATGNAQQLEFNPTTSKDASDFKYISISAGDENFTDKAYIQFGYGNTLRKMTFGENTMVYVMNDDDDYAAARVEELAGTIPVHFVPIADGFYTITVETKNIENLNYMHLIDNITNTDIDLLAEPSYTFKASESDNADRFHLVFDFNNYTGVNENYTNDNFAHQIGDEIFVSGEGTLQVFDVLGRFVTGYNVNGDKRISTAEFNTGVYIFRMVGTEVKTQKIIVR